MRLKAGFTIALITVGVVLLSLLSASYLVGTFAPAVPRDIFHRAVISDAGCVTCHTPGRQAPLRMTHAPATECMACHRQRNAR